MLKVSVSEEVSPLRSLFADEIGPEHVHSKFAPLWIKQMPLSQSYYMLALNFKANCHCQMLVRAFKGFIVRLAQERKRNL